MPNGEKKGITVRIDADLHAEVSQYLRDHSMTMAEFVSLALDDELHPKNQMKEGNTMANTRTIAVQVPEDLFQRIKDYLQRNNMTQRQFLIGLMQNPMSTIPKRLVMDSRSWRSICVYCHWIITTQFSICVVACAVHMNARPFWTACNTALN